MQRRCSGQQTFANDLGKDHFEFLRTTSMAADHAFRIPMSSNSAETARRTKYACLVEVTPSQADSCPQQAQWACAKPGVAVATMRVTPRAAYAIPAGP